VTKVETRVERTNGRPRAVGSSIKALPVTRKATNPRLTRVEGAVLLTLLLVLSAVVFVGVSGAVRKSVAAACDANANAVTSGLAALRAVNVGGMPTTSAGWERALLTKGAFVGAPFVSSWPRSPDYTISVAGAGARADSGDAVVPQNGDVLVTIVSGNKVFDASDHVATACATA